MGKQTKRTYKEKEKIVKELLSGASYQYVASKYNVSRLGTIANWKKKYLEGTLNQDNRGKPKKDIEDIDILKKSYALLIEIRKAQIK